MTWPAKAGGDVVLSLEYLQQLTDLQQLAAGRPAAGRPPFPHELRAGIRSAGRARAGLDAITAQTKARLLADRTAFLELVRRYAAGVLAAHPSAAGLDARALMLALGGASTPLTALPGLPELLAASSAFHFDALADAARLGALHVRAEARAQGRRLPPATAAFADPPPVPPGAYRPTVPTTALPGPKLATELVARAQHAAESPLVDVAGELRDTAMNLAAGAYGYGQIVDDVLTVGDGLSTAGLEADLGDALAQQAWGLGRSDGADELAAGGFGEPVQTYASELDDANTCGPCFDIDGTVFPTREEGERAYAGGVYEGCLGGGRCRGTLVYVWGSESPATVT